MESAAAAEARALLASGRALEAAVRLEAVLAQSPRWGRGWLLLGQARAREGDHDAAAVAFRRAGGDCADASPALATAASENLQLCSSRILPRHALAWLHDTEREDSWSGALQAALRATPGARVLCTGSTSACVALHAALAVRSGAREAAAMVGCRLVAEAGAGAMLASVRLEARLPFAQPFRADVLCWDVGNTLNTGSLLNLRAARADCSAQAQVLPRGVCVKACVVECDALAELNAVDEVRISAADVVDAGGDAALAGDEDAVFSFAHFRAGFERSTRAVQLQAASMRPWRALTETVTLLRVDPAHKLESDAPAGAWVDAPVLSDGRGHAVLTWLEVDLSGAVLSTGPPELASPGCCAGPLSLLHCTQYATFAAAPWQLQSGSALQLRGMVTPDGVQVELSPGLSVAGGSSAASSVPDYHASMLNDKRRNAAYLSGIRAAIEHHCMSNDGAAPRVLDIGAGAGLLSMMAASAGAEEVVACERDAGLAAAACADIDANDLGGAVTMVGAHSRMLCDDNVGKFDVIVSEIFGSDALSEAVLPTLAHAQAALLNPAGTFVPGKLVIRAALACSGAMRLQASPSGDTPVDALRRSFDTLAPLRCSAHLPDVAGMRLLSDAAGFELDFNARPLATSGVLHADVVATADGEVDAVAYWFDVVFSDGAHVATGPDDGRRAHWMQTLFRIAPRAVRAGERLALQLEYRGDRTFFKLAH